MFKRVTLVVLIITSSISCKSRKEYVLTDNEVKIELAEKRDRYGKPVYNTELSDNDVHYFSKKLEVSEAEIENTKLYSFVKYWEGTKYIYGGETRSGIDCSALMRELYSYVYNKKIPRTAAEIAMDKRIGLFKETENLREGDLVFFRITDEKIITHVGIYLKNGKFFSANRFGGTEISSLKKAYWKKNFITAGRFQ